MHACLPQRARHMNQFRNTTHAFHYANTFASLMKRHRGSSQSPVYGQAPIQM